MFEKYMPCMKVGKMKLKCIFVFLLPQETFYQCTSCKRCINEHPPGNVPSKFHQCTLCQRFKTPPPPLGKVASIHPIGKVMHHLRNSLFSLTADFSAISGVLPLPHLRVSAPQNTTFQYVCIFDGKFTVTTFKSRFSHCLNCLESFTRADSTPKIADFSLCENG